MHFVGFWLCVLFAIREANVLWSLQLWWASNGCLGGSMRLKATKWKWWDLHRIAISACRNNVIGTTQNLLSYIFLFFLQQYFSLFFLNSFFPSLFPIFSFLFIFSHAVFFYIYCHYSNSNELFFWMERSTTKKSSMHEDDERTQEPN